MKAAFAAVLGGMQNLDDCEHRERPVDRLAALAAGARCVPDEDRNGNQVRRATHEQRQAILASLGVDLVAFKHSQRALSGVNAFQALAEILAWPSWWPQGEVGLSPVERFAVARWAIHEWAEERCPPRPKGCGGALVVPTQDGVDGTQRTMICSVCAGTGKRRWSDQERTQAMGAAHDEGMNQAHRIIAHAEMIAVRRGAKMLERW